MDPEEAPSAPPPEARPEGPEPITIPTSQQPPPPTPQPATTFAAETPLSSEAPASVPAPNPPVQQQKPQFETQPLQRPLVPPLPRARPPLQQQQPYSHFQQQVSTPSATSSTSIISAPSVSSSAVQRGGLAVGVPAHHHHPRPPQQQGGSVPFSSFGPTSSFGGMQPRSSLGVSDQSSNYNSQGRLPVQGIQTIGVVGSLSNASLMRPASASMQNQLRPGQPPLRSITPGTIAATPTQKLSNQGMARAASLGSQAGPVQSSHTLQQPWMSNQVRPVHASSTSYRPQVRPQSLQQRPVQQQQHSLPQKQPQHSLPQKPQQQQKNQPQQQHQITPPNQTVISQNQQIITKNQQGMPQQQQLALRATGQKVQNLATGQPNVPGAIIPFSVDDPESGNHILRKRSIHELVSQIDPSEKLEPEVEDILMEIADDFIDSITTVACSLAKHRKSNTLEAKDVLLHLERNWNMTLPGFSGDDIRGYKKPPIHDIHKERLALIRKSMAGSNEAGSVKNNTLGQHNANVKIHAAKASAIGSPKLL